MTTFTEPSISDHSAKAALLAVMAVFCVVVVAGWNRIIVHLLPPSLALLAWILAAIIAFIAVVLARGIAAEKIRGDQVWIAYFAVLFVISALGTMNVAFYYGEGPKVRTTTIDFANTKLDSLDATAKKILRDPTLEQERAKIEDLLSNLRGEITNKNGGKTCGVGDVAKKIIGELRLLLPKFRELSGSDKHACAGKETKFEALAGEYDRIARELFRNSPAYVEANGVEKDKVLEALSKRVTEAKAGFKTETVRGGSVAAAQDALETAKATYEEMLTKLEGIHGAPVDLLRSIDISQARELGGIAQLLPTLIKRWREPSTWMYVILAISLDVILIACFMRVLRGRAIHGSVQVAGKPIERDLSFLWVNP